MAAGLAASTFMPVHETERPPMTDLRTPRHVRPPVEARTAHVDGDGEDQAGGIGGQIPLIVDVVQDAESIADLEERHGEQDYERGAQPGMRPAPRRRERREVEGEGDGDVAGVGTK